MKIKLSTVSLLGLTLAALGSALASSAQAAGTGIPGRASAPPSLVIDHVSISPGTFYPLVYDGYKDTTTMSYRLNRAAYVTARVYNSNGSVIRKDALGTRYSGDHSWTWGGRNNDYGRVRPDTFRIQITATADRTRSASEPVTVATSWRTAVVTKPKGGYYVGSTATRRSYDGSYCYADSDYYYDDTDLDCWGGAYAQANDHFDIPADAYNLSWHVSGVTGCCPGGTISKWGTRLDANEYRVSVKVTYWRDYDIREVTLSYSYKYRV